MIPQIIQHALFDLLVNLRETDRVRLMVESDGGAVVDAKEVSDGLAGELFRFHSQQTREIGAYLCGRRPYETMLYWETVDTTGLRPDQVDFSRIWRAVSKVVFSTTLESVTGNARLADDGVAGEVAKVKRQPGNDVVSVGGAGFASSLIKLDLIDEYRPFVSPVVLGGGTPYFPALPKEIRLELLETRTFGSRIVYVRYRRVQHDTSHEFNSPRVRWWARQDSNLRPEDYESPALTS
jgi:dihydrofolate reductase